MNVVTVGTSTITKRMINEMRNVGINIYACISRDLEKARTFSKENGVGLYADNYDAVLKSKDFDFVYLGIPNALHYSYAKKALLAGKNVIVEKPFCLNQKQTAELLSIAVSKKIFIFENMRVYHTLAYKTIKQELDRIKPIRMVSLNYSKYSSKYDHFKNDLGQTVFSLEYGSGALMDLGCYNISFIIGLFGLPLNATYTCTKAKGVDISGIATLQYKDFICHSVACKDSNSINYMNIAGENGYICFNGDPSFIDSYEVHYNGGKYKKVEYKEPMKFTTTLRDIKNIYMNKDYFKFDYYSRLVLMEMKVLDQLRKSANIKYLGE